jgi:hypothetical protein
MQFDSLCEDKPGVWRRNGQSDDKTAFQAWNADKKPLNNLKDRKRRYLAAQEAEKRKPINRPGKKAGGKTDGTLGIADIADRLEEYNGGGIILIQLKFRAFDLLMCLLVHPSTGGYRPKDTDVLKILLKVHGALAKLRVMCLSVCCINDKNFSKLL